MSRKRSAKESYRRKKITYFVHLQDVRTLQEIHISAFYVLSMVWNVAHDTGTRKLFQF